MDDVDEHTLQPSERTLELMSTRSLLKNTNKTCTATNLKQINYPLVGLDLV